MIETYLQSIQKEAKAYVATATITPLPLDGYVSYLETGNRLVFETAYFARRRQLAILALAYMTTHEQETKKLLEQVIWEICNEYTWALPAHLPVEKNPFKQSSVWWIDLFAAETAQTLAEIMELMGAEFTLLTQNRIREEIDQRLFQPFEENHWEWEEKKNNWSGVIGGCIGMAALSLLEKNSVRQGAILQKVDHSLQSYLKGFALDGACEEGVGYWSYGFGYYIYFAEKLADMLGDETYLNLPKVKEIAAFPYYVVRKNQQALPFSDYNFTELPSGLLSFCHQVFQVPIPDVVKVNEIDFDHCYRFAQLYRNLIWTEKTEVERPTIMHYFSDVEWGIFESEAQDLFFAAKGGHNEESHNHIDLGHFIFGTPNELFLTDLGAGEYTKDYFDEEKRYQYLVNNASGHSLPIINDCCQQAGAVAATATKFIDTPKGKRFSLDLTKTYEPSANLKQFQRSLVLIPEESTLELRDYFRMKKAGNKIIESFVTTYPVERNGQTVSIKGRQTCELIFGEEVKKIDCLKKMYHDHEGNTCQATLIQTTYTISMEAEVVVKMKLVH